MITIKQTDENIGKIFGCYEVLSVGESSIIPSGQKKKNYICRCIKCNNIRPVNSYKLRNNNYQHCDKCDVTREPIYNLEGQVFGNLTVIKRVDNHIQPSGITKVMYECLCDCGKSIIVGAGHLKSGHTRSCGCMHASYMQQVLVRDLTGFQFGKLTVLEKTAVKNHRQHWLCLCDCGRYREASSADLTSGKVKSCGCLYSIAEYEMSSWFDDNNYLYEPQYTFDECRDIRKLPFDFAIKDINNNVIMLLELHGQQHYGPFTYCGESKDVKIQNYKERIRKDAIKETYCKTHNIPLLIIKYTDFHRKDKIFENFYNSLIWNMED